MNDNFTRHRCRECMDWFATGEDENAGGCSEQCRPCRGDSTACYRLRLCAAATEEKTGERKGDGQ